MSKKFYIGSFNRASDGVLDTFRGELRDFITDDLSEAVFVLVCGDRFETFDFALKCFRMNKLIVHLWAGELSQGCHDEVYRHSITLMSSVQLCTNEFCKGVVEDLCRSVRKVSNVFVVGNVYLHNAFVDESLVPKGDFDLVLYNPPTLSTRSEVILELASIRSVLFERDFVWVSPNGDVNSDLVYNHVTHRDVPRNQFLGLLKNCKRFISNSSCSYYEAPCFLSEDKILRVGVRNCDRSDGYRDVLEKDVLVDVLKNLCEEDLKDGCL